MTFNASQIFVSKVGSSLIEVLKFIISCLPKLNENNVQGSILVTFSDMFNSLLYDYQPVNDGFCEGLFSFIIFFRNKEGFRLAKIYKRCLSF